MAEMVLKARIKIQAIFTKIYKLKNKLLYISKIQIFIHRRIFQKRCLFRKFKMICTLLTAIYIQIKS